VRGRLRVDAGERALHEMSLSSGRKIRRLLEGGFDGDIGGVEVEMRAPEGYRETPTGWQLLVLRLKQRGRGEPLPSLIGALHRAKELAGIHAERRQSTVHRADLHLRPPVAGVPSLDFRAARGLVDVGYRYALKQLQEAGWADRQW